MKNDFQLFYKPYSFWAAVCQQTFTTAEALKEGKEAKDIVDSTTAVMVYSIVVFSVNLVMFFVVVFTTDKKKTGDDFAS